MSHKPRDPAWIPPAYDIKTVEALKALYAGEGTAHQQRLALDWIINVAAGTYDMNFRSDADGGERETSFSLGRTFVGQQIVKLVNYAPALMDELRKKNGR